MSRATLIVGALIFALAAAGVLVWTGVLDVSGMKTSAPTAPTATNAPPTGTSREAQLVNDMTAAAAGGGFAASFVEADIKKWQIAGGHKLERFSVDGSDVVFARLSSSVALSPQFARWEDLGLSMTLPSEFSEGNKGYAVEVGVVARKSPQNGSDTIGVVFATQQTGNSGWNKFPLTQEFQLFTFRWTIPPLEGAYSQNPVLVVHADTEGLGRSVEILGAYVKPSR